MTNLRTIIDTIAQILYSRNVHTPRELWQEELKHALRTAEDLFSGGYIAREEIPAYEKILKRYQFLLPGYYADLIDRANPMCPIRLQAIPNPVELDEIQEFSSDPLSDLRNQPAPHLTHRYVDRVLMHLTPLCSMYCRFCFRKTLLNEMSADLFGGNLDLAFDYLKRHTEVREVIFSGGDPFMVSDEAMSHVISRLQRVPHLQRLRFHTRVPVTFPIRVTETLISIIIDHPFSTTVVTHFNHPKEFTEESANGVSRMREKGITLLNQSVLLKGVNDNAKTLVQLSEMLSESGIDPYYLHHPDRAKGTHHFDISMEGGLKIYNELKSRVPVNLVPKYVVDTVYPPFKVEVSDYLLLLGTSVRSISMGAMPVDLSASRTFSSTV